MKRFFKSFILTILILFIVAYWTNSETNFFKDFRTNNPELSEKQPWLADFAELLSKQLSQIPTISQIAGNVSKEDMPVEPETFAENAYIKDSPLLTFYDKEAAGIKIDGNTFTVFGILADQQKSNLVLRMLNDKGDIITENTFATDTKFEFSKTFDFPETNEKRLKIDLYTGEKRYGDYIGWINDYIYVQKTESGWILEKSPVSDHNETMYEKSRSITKALKATENIQSDNDSINKIAIQLTENCSSDYEKIKALHDWICTYLHYDNDSLSKSDIAPYTAMEVLKTKKAVCIGYANLYAALCRSIDIPCYVVTGYALGISSGQTEWTNKIVNGTEENHAWNEAYVDGRWVIIDSTWDTFNSFENGEMKKGTHISRLYFDANIDFFSNNHKIMHYE